MTSFDSFHSFASSILFSSPKFPYTTPRIHDPRVRSRGAIRGWFARPFFGRSRKKKMARDGQGKRAPRRVISLMALNCDVVRSSPSHPPRQRWSNSPLEIRKLNWYPTTVLLLMRVITWLRATKRFQLAARKNIIGPIHGREKRLRGFVRGEVSTFFSCAIRGVDTFCRS